MAGFGTLQAGTGSFGTQQINDLDLSETVSVSEALSVSVPFKVESAVSLSKTLVKLDYTTFVDLDHASNFDPANYTIVGLSIFNVDPLGSSGSVILQTSDQAHSSYTVTVNPTPGVIQGAGGDQLDPLFNTAAFLGNSTPVTFTAVPQSRIKIRLTFSQPMLFDAEFADPANFLITSLQGEGIELDGVEQLSPTQFQLLLVDALVPAAPYTIEIASTVQSVAGDAVFPNTALIHWQEAVPKPIRLGIASFTGEVSGGLLGTPAGQVFLSPAFGSSVANSVLEIDRMSACTRAHDVYTVPSLPDPQVLYTFPAPGGTSATIGRLGGVLRASAYRLGLAAMNLSDMREDALPAPTDGPAEGQLIEPIDITRASFLNDGRWRSFPGVGASFGLFRTADNQTPIGPGPTVGPFTIP